MGNGLQQRRRRGRAGWRGGRGRHHRRGWCLRAQALRAQHQELGRREPAVSPRVRKRHWPRCRWRRRWPLPAESTAATPRAGGMWRNGEDWPSPRLRPGRLCARASHPHQRRRVRLPWSARSGFANRSSIIHLSAAASYRDDPVARIEKPRDLRAQRQQRREPSGIEFLDVVIPVGDLFDQAVHL